MTNPTPLPVPDLTSVANPRVKAVVRLRDRRERDRTGLTIVDGSREIRRALEARVVVEEVFVCERLVAGPEARAALDLLRARNVRTTTTTEAVIEKLAFGNRTEGFVAVIRQPHASLADLAVPEDPLLVVLEGVEKPGNIGAVARTADGSGADALIVAATGADPYGPNAIRASAGIIFALPVAVASARDIIAWLTGRGIRIVAARVAADRTYTDTDLTGPLAVVLGSEADGLTDAWVGDSVEAVRLPMRGVADSLNVSVAAAVILYEAGRQREHHMDRGD